MQHALATRLPIYPLLSLTTVLGTTTLTKAPTSS
jgi:hypothetical protein